MAIAKFIRGCFSAKIYYCFVEVELGVDLGGRDASVAALASAKRSNS